MAATRTRGFLPSGSIQWVNDENAQVEKHCAQEVEDFGFSARNEFDWLNEHMHDIFAKDQTNVIEIFKTPGKLRGKTPRTGRKRNALEAREPLTDIFVNTTPKAQPVFSIKSKSPVKTTTFKVAEDTIELSGATPSKKANTDSGYHGSEDEMDIDQTTAVAVQNNILHQSPPQEVAELTRSPSRGSNAESHTQSAEENENDIKKAIASSRVAANLEGIGAKAQVKSEDAREEVPLANGDARKADAAVDDESAIDESHTSSRGSTPAKNLVRKSSLTFAALPAREPLTTKKSIGTRLSRTSNLDQLRTSMQIGAPSGRFTGGKSLGASQYPLNEPDEEALLDTNIRNKDTLIREESDSDSKVMNLHNKSSTQRLHERINLLGKSQSTRPTKSIPSTTNVIQPDNVEMPLADSQAEASHTSVLQASDRENRVRGEDEDDWIQPPRSVHGQQLSELAPKSVEALGNTRIITKHTNQRLGQGQDEPRALTTVTEGPLMKHTSDHVIATSDAQQALLRSRSSAGMQKPDEEEESVDGGNWQVLDSSTTPPISPTATVSVDGPLSASKFKLQSIMQTARGLFSSSAGASAQAKMETLSPNAAQQQNSQQTSADGTEAVNSMPKAKKQRDSIEGIVPVAATTSDGSTTRNLRKSADKGVQRTGQENAKQARSQKEQSQILPHDGREPAREATEPVRVTKDVLAPAKTVRQSPRKVQHQEESEMPETTASIGRKPATVAPPQSQGQQSQISRPKDPRRPTKPAKEPLSKPKPQPVAIRVGTLSTQRIPLTNTNLSAGLQESLAPPQPKQATVAGTKKPSLQSSVSSTGLKSQTNFAKPKALIAAEKKKEQDEKEAQRKNEQKREIERRKAAQQEESRLQEQIQRQQAEKQRQRERAAAAEDPKRVAQREAIEKRRLELKQKDQPRVPAGSSARHELGGARPVSRQHNIPDSSQSVNGHHAVNLPKAPIKRVFDPEADDAPVRTRPQQAGPSYVSHDNKRRKTEDSEPEDFPMRPTHAPPVRQSNIRKEGHKTSIFSNHHAALPPQVPHHQHATSLLKSTTQGQAFQQHTAYQAQAARPGHHPDIKQYAQNGAKIPFAEHPNPSIVNTQAQQANNTYKTPFQSKMVPPKTASPQYQNGENIQLDDIPTDSEDGSESDDEPTKAKPANLPEWAQSPNLRNLLETQEERMDADTVFGPVASPRMEEMFKERHHRFRSRTSSANWAGADRLTEEEIRRDVEARQRLRRDGGWTFGL